jgi:crotonobetainyl-CoA:carnitine CoA-transferase CaiB-like acyl-CoA transferase
VQDWASARSVTEAVAALQGAGLPAARLLRPARFNADPQLAAAKYYQEVAHPLSGSRLYPVFPMIFSFEAADRKPHWGPAPLLGEHNHDVLGGELGLAADELAALEKSQVIGVEPLPKSGLI